MSDSIINYSRRIAINNTAFTVEYYVSEYNPDNTGTLFLPESQRLWAWNYKKGLAKMVQLIDSVFMGFPIPSIILNNTRRGGRSTIYDGRHRIETLHRFYTDQFPYKGKLFSELCEGDKRVFLERTIPATVTTMATANDLAEMFIRLNAGAPLKDSDLFWANRHTPLVESVIRLICNNDRLSAALGNLKLNNRPDLSNWVALVAGLHANNAGAMTRSYVRICDEIGLNAVVDERAIRSKLNAFCTLLEDANTEFPATDPEKRKLKSLGSFGAFFFADLMRSADQALVIAKWIGIIGRLRGTEEASIQMKQVLRVSGPANMTNAKIETTMDAIDRYMETGVLGDVATEEGDDDESV